MSIYKMWKDAYCSKLLYGAVIGNRLVLFDNKVQRSLSKTRYKRLTNLNSDKSLQGLVIDWHLANTEMGFDNMIVEPVSDYQPTYAHA